MNRTGTTNEALNVGLMPKTIKYTQLIFLLNNKSMKTTLWQI